MKLQGQVWDFWTADKDQTFYVIVEIFPDKDHEESKLILIEADISWWGEENDFKNKNKCCYSNNK